MNALLEATEQQDAPRVRAMIEGAANANAVVDKVHPPRVPPRHGDWAKWDGWSALKLACYIGGSTGDLNIARLLLEAGASTELRLNKRGWAALMFFAGAPACGGANIPVVELLLDYGAEVNAVDDIGMTPLISAAYTGNAAMVDTLLARGANVDVKDTDGDSALVLAVGTDEESEDSDEAAAVIAVGAASGGTLEGGSSASGDDGNGESDARAAAVERRVLEFYREHCPAKATEAEAQRVAELYAGREGVLFARLRQKYLGEAPPPPAGAEEEIVERPSGSIKLGLGDFVFYSLLVSKAALAGFVPMAASFLAILVGLIATLIVLALVQRALPALPFSLFLGVAVYLVANYTTQGVAFQLATNAVWM